MLYPVILCGGSGTRLWPLSRELYPKQFADLGLDKSLFRQCLERAAACPDVNRFFIVSNQQHRLFVAADLLETAISATVILEPEGRNTAPAIALAAHAAYALDKEAILLVMPSDHKISDNIQFADSIVRAFPAAQNGSIVTFGLDVKGPATNFGYIKCGSKREDTLFDVEQFIEKPDLATAERLYSEGNSFWNSGIFLVRADVYLQELKTYAPTISLAMENAWELRREKGSCIYPDTDAFCSSPADSIDYCIMMKTKRAVMSYFPVVWSDLGSWDALYTIGEKDENKNVCIGDVLQVDSENCYLHATHNLIAAIDVEDLVIVATRDAVLVVPRKSVQKVKSIVETLKKANRQEYQLHPKVSRPWGNYETLAYAERFKVKRIVVNPGATLSLQMHYHRAEHWVVVSGTAEVTCGENTALYTENQSTYIPIGTKHRLHNPGKIPLIIIEIQSGAYVGEDDIIRFEDVYEREDTNI